MAGDRVTIQDIGAPINAATIASWVQKETVRVAESELRKAVAQGFDNEPVVVTDGVPRRDYAAVKPFGVVEFIARPQMAEVVRWALTELQKRSPVGGGDDPHPGLYASSHVVMINGAEVVGNIWGALRNLQPTDHVQIANTVVYARKLEGATASKSSGRKRRRPTSRQAPNGIYRAVQADLIGRYGKSMFFDFKYVPLNLGVKVWGFAGGGRVKRRGRWETTQGRKRVRRDQVYPALQFFIKPTGARN